MTEAYRLPACKVDPTPPAWAAAGLGPHGARC
jgi:hypothetical protein